MRRPIVLIAGSALAGVILAFWLIDGWTLGALLVVLAAYTVVFVGTIALQPLLLASVHLASIAECVGRIERKEPVDLEVIRKACRALSGNVELRELSRARAPSDMTAEKIARIKRELPKLRNVTDLRVKAVLGILVACVAGGAALRMLAHMFSHH